jgi:hypothetical protein
MVNNLKFENLHLVIGMITFVIEVLKNKPKGF